jgi:hypothetical protein
MKLFKLLITSTLMLMFCTSTAYAEYSFQLVKPPGAFDANLFGINNAGKAVGNAFDEFGFFTESYVYDMKKGTYESLGWFDSIDIASSLAAVGLLSTPAPFSTSRAMSPTSIRLPGPNFPFAPPEGPTRMAWSVVS